ncbi:MAG: hypothetical protein ACOY3U_09640 [Bacillota bacterium]
MFKEDVFFNASHKFKPLVQDKCPAEPEPKEESIDLCAQVVFARESENFFDIHHISLSVYRFAGKHQACFLPKNISNGYFVYFPEKNFTNLFSKPICSPLPVTVLTKSGYRLIPTSLPFFASDKAV